MSECADTVAVAHFERTGLILPGYQADIARYMSQREVTSRGE